VGLVYWGKDRGILGMGQGEFCLHNPIRECSSKESAQRPTLIDQYFDRTVENSAAWIIWALIFL